MKVPTDEFASVVSFYRDVIGLKVKQATEGSVVFEFGGKNLWIDCSASASHAEIWLELLTDDVIAAAEHLSEHQVVRRDEIETLPADMKAFWIKNPANIIHLVAQGS
ncbi:MAG: hypothetical protein K0Q55_1771 [Verrucomicrobia bacterium]|nr:hypothetical protein [Verrucomicrobiota bacterium]